MAGMPFNKTLHRKPPEDTRPYGIFDFSTPRGPCPARFRLDQPMSSAILSPMTKESHKPMPPWDKAAPAESLRRLGLWYNERARGMFLEAGTHAELYFLFSQDGQGTLIQVPPGMPREIFQVNLQGTMRKLNTYGVIQIGEVWAYLPPRPDDHTYRQVLEGEMKVSELKPEDKTEALMIRYQSLDGDQCVWVNPILREASGVSLGETIEIKGTALGRFGSLF